MDIAEELELLKLEILRDKDLPLASSAKNLVFGKGNPCAKIMFVGEAPGANEDLQGLPFVGVAGKNLDKLLARTGLSLEDVFIANILKYRPPENAPPSKEQIKSHTPYLIRQIKIIRPDVVCSLGNYATKFFLAGLNPELMEKQLGITSVHGKTREIEFEGLKFKLIPLFHPAAIIYNQKLLPLWGGDMEIVKKEIGQRKLI
ncbi:MAG: uracil-DNA glycosylase [Nanoarchaeota archaeon]